MTSVSVVMPVRNGERFLEQAIASVTSQSFADLELIIVLDSSTDRSELIARTLGERDQRIRVDESPGNGLVDALNRGCRVASGDFIARLDADDRMREARLQRQHDFLRSHPEVVAVGSSAVVIDEASGEVGRIVVPARDATLRSRLVRNNPFVHSSMMLRKSAVVSAGGYRHDFPLVEDLDLWLRMARLGKLANLAEPLVDYRRHPSGLSARNSERQRLNHHLCILEWKRREGVTDDRSAERIRSDLATMFRRVAELDEDPAEFQIDDLRLFRRMLSHLGSGEVRRLRRLISRAREAQRIGRTAAMGFLAGAIASRISYDLRCRAAARKLRPRPGQGQYR
jgi:glycosyltransferase involved in cell wall biosynthesis